MNCINCGTPITDLTKPCPGCGKLFSSKERQLYLLSRQANSQAPVADARREASPVQDENTDKTQVFTPPMAPQAPAAPQQPYEAAAPRSGRFEFDSGAGAGAPVGAAQAGGEIFNDNYAGQGQYGAPVYPEDMPVDQGDSYDYAPQTRHTGRNIVIAIVIIAVLCVCGLAIWQICKKLGFIGSGTNGGAEITSSDSLNIEDITGAAIGDTALLGQYTVSSSEKNIIMYQYDDGSRIIATIPSNTIITVTEISNGYAKTTYKNSTGWVSIKDISYTPGASGQAQAGDDDTGDYNNYNEYPAGTYEVVDTPAVNVRSAADTSDDGNIIGKAYRGEQYDLSSFDGEWARITLSDGQRGWVYMGYMEYVGSDSGSSGGDTLG